MDGLVGGRRLRIGVAIGALSAFAVAWLLGPATAAGSTAIGSNFVAESPCTGPSTWFQQATDPTSPGYTVPAAGGVITSWSTQQGPSSAQVKLGVLHPTGNADEFTTTGSSATETLDTSGLRTFLTRLPAQAGDTIAALIVSGTYGCAFAAAPAGDVGQRDALAVHDAGTFTYSEPAAGVRINIAAAVEPDADADGFGDETQDQCPTDASKQTECDPPETTITKEPKSKTRKHKVKFKFNSDEPGSSFECKIDKKPYKPCSSPKKFKAKDGKHKFAVRAIDANGNVDPSPDKDKFKVV